MAPAIHFFRRQPGEYINANSQAFQATNLSNIVQNPDERVAITLTWSSQPILCQNILKDHVLSEHLGLVSHVRHRLCDCLGRQEGVLPQLGVV